MVSIPKVISHSYSSFLPVLHLLTEVYVHVSCPSMNSVSLIVFSVVSLPAPTEGDGLEGGHDDGL